MYKIIIVSILLLLPSCATQVTSIKSGENKVLEEGRGFILLGVETNRDLKQIKISGPTDIILSSKDIKEGSNYLIVDLTAGEYIIDQVRLDNYWRVDFDDEEYWNFTITEGKINYVGHLELTRRGKWSPWTRTELVNRSSEALEFLESSYATLLKNNPIIYEGPGEDRFYEFLNEMKGK